MTGAFVGSAFTGSASPRVAPPNVDDPARRREGRRRGVLSRSRQRGGVALTLPRDRRTAIDGISHLFVYAGPWKPQRFINAYAPTNCAIIDRGPA